MICSIKKNTIAVGNHAGKLRDMAHEVKYDKNAMKEAAKLMSVVIPSGSVLIPIPSHTGDATYTHAIASEISRIKNGKVIDALQGFERESSHEAKLQHRNIDSQIWFYKIEDVPQSVILIDNCVSSGKTIEMARKALGRPNAVCVSLTLVNSYKHNL